MKMSSKKYLMSLLSIMTVASLAGCNRTSTSKPSTDSGKSTAPSTNPSTTPEPEEKVNLVMSCYYDDTDRHMKFITGKAKLPYTAPDGTTYNEGDWKPVWKQIQKNLNMSIDDVSPATKVAIKTQFDTLVTSAFKVDGKQINIAQGNSDQIMSEGTTNNTLVNLNDYLDKMPNFKKFLSDNPVVKKTISTADGKIFYAPYFDGYDDIERMMMVRQDWAEKLLDGDLPTDLDTNITLTKNYTPFYTSDIDCNVDVLKADGSGKETIKKTITAEQNIIAQMNAKASLNGAEAVKLLRDYIDARYGSTYGTKRSELFCGGRAAYDIDELVALFKVVRACPKFLTGKDNAEVIPFFPRASTSDRTNDLYRFLQFFGLRGTESRNQWMFVDKDGKLKDVRGTEEFKKGLKKLHEMYEDKLIFQNFDQKLGESSDFRGALYNYKDTSTQFGFATYDYNQTTTIYSKENRLIASVLPAVADFDDGTSGNFIHYTESWRSVKTQGWFITAETKKDQKKLDKSLKLFDYLYSTEGNRLMSYGPDAYLAKNADGSIKTMDYQGKQVPVLSDDTKNEMKTLTGGNYTNYYRYYLGATFPVGYVKEQGMEYQTVAAAALPSLNTINKAIQHGVLQHVNHKTDNASTMQDIVPTTLPFTKAESTTLGSEFTQLNTAFTSDKNKKMYISDIVMNGFGTIENLDFSEAGYCNTINNTLKLTQFTQLYNDAYSKFKAL